MQRESRVSHPLWRNRKDLALAAAKWTRCNIKPTTKASRRKRRWNNGMIPYAGLITCEEIQYSRTRGSLIASPTAPSHDIPTAETWLPLLQGIIRKRRETVSVRGLRATCTVREKLGFSMGWNLFYSCGSCKVLVVFGPGGLRKGTQNKFQKSVTSTITRKVWYLHETCN